jgi:hypothetical protein
VVVCTHLQGCDLLPCLSPAKKTILNRRAFFCHFCHSFLNISSCPPAFLGSHSGIHPNSPSLREAFLSGDFFDDFMMHLSQLGLSSQRYTPDDDYTFEHHEVISNARRPLGESTGNAQSHSLGPLGFCQQDHLSLSSLHSIQPPIVPTQAITSTFGTRLRNHLSIHRDVSLRESPMARYRGSRNSIYTWKNFADYRAKVMQKEKDKENPTWPLYLEDAFLDGSYLESNRHLAVG